VTAIVLACQPRRKLLHLATDAAMYRQDQCVVAFGTKVAPISHWPGVVTCTGNAAAVPLFGWALAKQFASWDEMVEGADAGLSRLADIVAEYGLSHAAVLLAGISAKRGPEAYTFQTTETLPPGVTQEEAKASPYFQPPYVLVKLPDVIMTPVAPPEMAIAAGYEGIDVDADPEAVVWSIRKVLAMQRHMPLPDGIGGIGGFAELTTVSAEGVTQRVIDRWPGDKIGAPLHHSSIDWDRWHTEHPMSRAKRELLDRKASKFRLVKP
jgi:hypothetical protein